jgi:glycosyltransferase involved in cell wall biosynthesis
MEAAACQLPLLCTDVSGVRDVIGDDYQADFIVPINNEDAFAKQLQYALTLPTSSLAAYGASLQQNLKAVVALYDNPQKQVDIWKHLCTNN